MKHFLIIFLMFFFISCEKKVSENSAVSSDTIKKPDEKAEISQKSFSKEVILEKMNDDLLQAIKLGNYGTFSDCIHPEKGVRFSMYAFVNRNEDKHFSKADFQKYFPTKTIFTWGSRDGTGEIYQATINNYFKKWIFKKDFIQSKYSFNRFQGSGNSLNNLKEIYPDADFTENYISGSEKYSGMDWNSLRFVFEKFEGKYYLVAVINDEWTI
ncbi:hypothetical protein [Chryseobacterium echinoideorum]|uniref:hypothetical protein n=1 Tax=Chryseobacterium echinoideorum TaxID=1549648 RepID=UPI001186DB2A|nr:hypothetical protein [Chryseobacterium echinoideorum]